MTDSLPLALPEKEIICILHLLSDATVTACEMRVFNIETQLVYLCKIYMLVGFVGKCLTFTMCKIALTLAATFNPNLSEARLVCGRTNFRDIYGLPLSASFGLERLPPSLSLASVHLFRMYPLQRQLLHASPLELSVSLRYYA